MIEYLLCVLIVTVVHGVSLFVQGSAEANVMRTMIFTGLRLPKLKEPPDEVNWDSLEQLATNELERLEKKQGRPRMLYATMLMGYLFLGLLLYFFLLFVSAVFSFMSAFFP